MSDTVSLVLLILVAMFAFATLVLKIVEVARQ